MWSNCRNLAHPLAVSMVCRGGSCESADLREPPSPHPEIRPLTDLRASCSAHSPGGTRHCPPLGTFSGCSLGSDAFRPDVLMVNALAHQPWLQFRLPQGDLPRLPSSLDSSPDSPLMALVTCYQWCLLRVPGLFQLCDRL